MQYRPPTGTIPDAPGSYQFYDAEGRVLYVGKAKSLRHRLPNYWQESAKLMPRTAQMVAQADHVEWVVVDSEVEAAIQQSLYRLMEGKTVVAIAHRLSTIAALG